MGRRRRSDSSSRSSKPASVVLFHKPNLGDKLQRLAMLSPLSLAVVEWLVDLMLTRIDQL
jgi:hypothetical protein